MMAAAALLASLGAASMHRCPAHTAVAEVFLGTPHKATPLHAASAPDTGMVHGRPWSWIPEDNVVLGTFPEEQKMLSCGNYYGYQCRRTHNNTQIIVQCKWEVCDVYTFVYHEPPRSTQTNGRLPLTLPADDWQTASCAPQFCLPVGGETGAPTECCKMTAFRKQVAGGGSISFTIDEAFGTMDAYYTVLAVAPGVSCGSNARQTSQEMCEEDAPFHNAHCRWAPSQGDAAARQAGVLSGIPTSSPTASPFGGRCVDNWCPRPENPPPRVPPSPACSASLTEPECHAPPRRFWSQTE